MTSQFSEMPSPSIFWLWRVSLVTFSYWSKFHVNIITGSGVMTISFNKSWPEIRKSEIPSSEFCQVFGNWGKLGIPYLARTYLIKCYWMLPNARVIAFTISELLRENQQGGGGGKITDLSGDFLIIGWNWNKKNMKETKDYRWWQLLFKTRAPYCHVILLYTLYPLFFTTCYNNFQNQFCNINFRWFFNGCTAEMISFETSLTYYWISTHCNYILTKWTKPFWTFLLSYIFKHSAHAESFPIR